MISIHRLQAQLQASAAQNMAAVAVPPFTCFFNPDDAATYANYAMPNEAVAAEAERPLALLEQLFRQRGRQPRFEYLEDYAPALAAILEARGYELELRSLLMVANPVSFRPAPFVPGLIIERVESTSVSDQQTFFNTQGRCFGGDDFPPATAQTAQQFWRRTHSVQKFLARLYSEPVGVGSLTAPHNGIAELAGIGTLAAYRHRGAATAVAAHITQFAFTQGIDTVFLTAGSPASGRVYQRVGFQPAGSGLAYRLQS